MLSGSEKRARARALEGVGLYACCMYVMPVLVMMIVGGWDLGVYSRTKDIAVQNACADLVPIMLVAGLLWFIMALAVIGTIDRSKSTRRSVACILLVCLVGHALCSIVVVIELMSAVGDNCPHASELSAAAAAAAAAIAGSTNAAVSTGPSKFDPGLMVYAMSILNVLLTFGSLTVVTTMCVISTECRGHCPVTVSQRYNLLRFRFKDDADDVAAAHVIAPQSRRRGGGGGGGGKSGRTGRTPRRSPQLAPNGAVPPTLSGNGNGNGSGPRLPAPLSGLTGTPPTAVPVAPEIVSDIAGGSGGGEPEPLHLGTPIAVGRALSASARAAAARPFQSPYGIVVTPPQAPVSATVALSSEPEPADAFDDSAVSSLASGAAAAIEIVIPSASSLPAQTAIAPAAVLHRPSQSQSHSLSQSSALSIFGDIQLSSVPNVAAADAAHTLAS